MKIWKLKQDLNKMVTKDTIIPFLMTDDLIIQSFVYSDKSAKYWKLQSGFTVELSNSKKVSIPKGYYYDMATVPKWLWSIVRPYNDGLFAFLVHDYLYVYKDKHGMNRQECDKEMLYWLNITNSNKFDNYLRYYVVRLFGWWVWFNITKKIKEKFKKLKFWSK